MPENMPHDPQAYDSLIHVIRRRRSVRRFKPSRTVPRETLLKIAEAEQELREIEQQMANLNQ